MIALLFPLTGCAPSLPPASPAPPIQASIDQTDLTSGEPATLTVVVLSAEAASVQLQPPSSEGLTITPTGQEGPLPAGDRLRHVFRYDVSGDDGSYVIQPGAIALDGAEPIAAPPIFIDIGVEGPSGGEMVGFSQTPEAPFPWLWLGLGAGALLLAGAGIAYARRPKTPPPPVPPEVRARKRWRDARGAGMTDPDLAIALSVVFRDYLQERHGFPAQANTSREILRSLTDRELASAAERTSLAQILEASDRLKYGREGGGQTFFDDLEAVFEDLLRAGEAADA